MFSLIYILSFSTIYDKLSAGNWSYFLIFFFTENKVRLIEELKARFRTSTTSLTPPPPHYTKQTHNVETTSIQRWFNVKACARWHSSYLLIVPRKLFCCNSSVLVRRWFLIWRLFWHCLFLISFSIGALRRLCFVTVAFPGYLQRQFW